MNRLTDTPSTDLDTLLERARAKGSDEAFREWIKSQPSCLTGDFSEFHDDGRAYSIPAHVRRSSAAGTAYKPPYACIPLTDAEHKLQSAKGEKACLERYLGGSWTVEEAKEFFDQKRIEYLTRWIES